MLPAALAVGALASALILVNARDEGQSASASFRTSADSFGRDLRLAAFAEAIEEARVVAALNELSALQQLAGLAAWPEPYVAPAPVAAAASAPRPSRPAAWTDASFSAAVLSAVNERRAAAGLPSVRQDGRIAQASASYAMRMNTLDEFGHSVDGSTLTSRLAAAGFSEPVVLGEVIAWSSGTPSPASIVQMWMDSPGHREQILSGTYQRGGAGCAFDGAEVHCVVNLAG
jgi:uncharacterized protein YkwD